MNIDCQTAQELIPAFLLEVLEADEQTVLRDHLRVCAACRAEADSLRAGADLLGLATPDAGEPAPRVKQRVMAAVHETSGTRVAVQPRRSIAWRWVAVFASAAVALLLIAGLGATVTSLQNQVNQQQAHLDRLTRIQVALQQFMLNNNVQTVPVKMADPSSSANVALYVSDDKVAMSVTGLPLLQGDSVYQCWWSDPQTGEMVPGSTFKVDENGAGVWVWPIPSGGEYKHMTITQESQPDHTQAEGPVILTVDL
ncbi:MAG TPA: anti-sigma factor [Anaerolineae bacterium]|nr:anti-sigma factor [Anaerolineae bacterium]